MSDLDCPGWICPLGFMADLVEGRSGCEPGAPTYFVEARPYWDDVDDTRLGGLVNGVVDHDQGPDYGTGAVLGRVARVRGSPHGCIMPEGSCVRVDWMTVSRVHSREIAI